MKRVALFLFTALISIWVKCGVNSSFFFTGRWIAMSVRIILRISGTIRLGQQASIREHNRIIIGENSSLSIGARSIIERGGEVTAVNGARVTIGADTSIGNYCNIRSDESIDIGNGCYFAQFVSVIDGGYDVKASTDPISRNRYVTRRVVIGNHVWLGAGAIVLPGVSVGDGAVVGAGAIVTKDVPPLAIVVGNPARVTSFRG